jgi:sulfatase modifying factor 1
MKKLIYSFSFLLILMSCSEENQADELEFVTIPEGIFFFGSELGAEHEGPNVLCRVSEFHLSTTEVSNEQFEVFVHETGYMTDAEKNGGFVFDGKWKIDPTANWRMPKGEKVNYEKWKDLPVVQVSYNDALAYCEWANCRLPSEIEWEYAAHRGKPDPMDANILRPMRNIPHLEKVNKQAKDQLGIYHQLGNVWEWCADVYNSEIHDKLSLISTTEPSHSYRNDMYEGRSYDPQKSNVSDTLRVIKGGSFLCQPGHCEGYQPEARQSAEQSEAYFHIGFRVVKKTN